MKEPQEKNEFNKWHRRFAVECNNLAWTLSEKTARTKAEDSEMLNAAHTAAFHWAKIGTAIQIMYAELLLAQVHALLGFGESSFQYAKRCLTFVNSNDSPDWEIAFVHAIMAHAGYAIDDRGIHRKFYDQAQKLGNGIDGENEKKHFLASFERIPKPA